MLQQPENVVFTVTWKIIKRAAVKCLEFCLRGNVEGKYKHLQLVEKPCLEMLFVLGTDMKHNVNVGLVKQINRLIFAVVVFVCLGHMGRLFTPEPPATCSFLPKLHNVWMKWVSVLLGAGAACRTHYRQSCCSDHAF